MRYLFSSCSVATPRTVSKNHKWCAVCVPSTVLFHEQPVWAPAHSPVWSDRTTSEPLVWSLLNPERGNQYFSPKKGNFYPPFGLMDLLIKARYVIRKSTKTAVKDAQMMKLYLSCKLCREIGASDWFFSKGFLIIIAFCWIETQKGENRIVSLWLFCPQSSFWQQHSSSSKKSVRRCSEFCGFLCNGDEWCTSSSVMQSF